VCADPGLAHEDASAPRVERCCNAIADDYADAMRSARAQALLGDADGATALAAALCSNSTTVYGALQRRGCAALETLGSLACQMASNAANSASGNDIFGRNSLLHWGAYDGTLTTTIELMDTLHEAISTMRQTNRTISRYADDLQESIGRLNERADEFTARIKAAKEALHAHATLAQSLGRELLEKRRDLSGRLPDPLQSESKALERAAWALAMDNQTENVAERHRRLVLGLISGFFITAVESVQDSMAAKQGLVQTLGNLWDDTSDFTGR
jgi:hypothetical protein